MEPTRPELLEQMRSPDAHRAWEKFYELYCTVILSYAQKHGLDESAAQDVLQETMVTLVQALPKFTYDPRRGKFRNFLLTIVHRKVLAAHRRAAGRSQVPLDAPAHADGLPAVEVLPDEHAPLPPDVCDRHWRESIQETALQRVRDDPAIQGRTWKVFEAYVVDDRSAGEVAKEYGLAKNAVYQIRSRVLARLSDEVSRLTAEPRLMV